MTIPLGTWFFVFMLSMAVGRCACVARKFLFLLTLAMEVIN